MISSERGSTGAAEMSWFQARWSGSEAAPGSTSGPGRGKTPHLEPSDGYGPSLAESAAPTRSRPAPAMAIVIEMARAIGAI